MDWAFRAVAWLLRCFAAGAAGSPQQHRITQHAAAGWCPAREGDISFKRFPRLAVLGS